MWMMLLLLLRDHVAVVVVEVVYTHLSHTKHTSLSIPRQTICPRTSFPKALDDRVGGHPHGRCSANRQCRSHCQFQRCPDGVGHHLHLSSPTVPCQPVKGQSSRTNGQPVLGGIWCCGSQCRCVGFVDPIHGSSLVTIEWKPYFYTCVSLYASECGCRWM